VSPILVRPVREQLEHDRVIRLLQVRLKRRHDVVANIGADQTVPVKIGQVMIYPDLVLTTADRAKKLVGTVEVETAESVNHLEAMAQWAHLGRARAPFHLYVPANCVEIARRLAAENGVNFAELWSFHTIGDQTRFTLVQKAAESDSPRRNAEPKTDKTAKPAAKAKPSAKTEKVKTVKKTARPAAKTAAKTAKKAPSARRR
jgi:pyruvate/2-oxoglutarate dehydrogenase complex dihydrolipoamide acyltransferase (E2) component